MMLEFPDDRRVINLDRQYMLEMRSWLTPVFSEAGDVSSCQAAGRTQWRSIEVREAATGAESSMTSQVAVCVRDNTLLALGNSEARLHRGMARYGLQLFHLVTTRSDTAKSLLRMVRQSFTRRRRNARAILLHGATAKARRATGRCVCAYCAGVLRQSAARYAGSELGVVVAARKSVVITKSGSPDGAVSSRLSVQNEQNRKARWRHRHRANSTITALLR